MLICCNYDINLFCHDIFFKFCENIWCVYIFHISLRHLLIIYFLNHFVFFRTLMKWYYIAIFSYLIFTTPRKLLTQEIQDICSYFKISGHHLIFWIYLLQWNTSALILSSVTQERSWLLPLSHHPLLHPLPILQTVWRILKTNNLVPRWVGKNLWKTDKSSKTKEFMLMTTHYVRSLSNDSQLFDSENEANQNWLGPSGPLPRCQGKANNLLYFHREIHTNQ